jgi:hypothetical protein
MAGLRDFLERRREEIRKKMEPLEAVSESLRAQLSANEIKLQALAKEQSDIEKALRALGKKDASETSVTIKDAILKILGDAPGGLTPREILAALNERFFDGTLLRTSMSPQLTRLKNDDRKIRQRGDKYFLA